MRAVFVSLLLLFSLSVCGQNTFVPDDNFEQALINLGFDSGPLDNYVSTRSIDTITRLELFNEGITDVTGLQDFRELRYLQLTDNQISSISLGSLSKLTSLILEGNLLTSIDVSQNPLLNNISIRNNNIVGLNVSQNLNLAFIDAANNPIGSLDVSQNSKIQRLYLNNTSLTYLDVRNGNNTNVTAFFAQNNPSLNCIYVDDKNYSIANWINIDSQTNFANDFADCPTNDLTYVPDDNFEQALIDLGYDSGPLDDYVTTSKINKVLILDINSLSIRDLTGLQDFVGLQNLNVSDNLFTQINITTLVNLEELYLENTQSTSLNLSQNLALKTVIISGTIFSLDFTNNNLLEEVSVTNSNVQFLDLRNQNNQLITSISLQNNANLSCVFVDDKNYSDTNWSSAIDNFVNFYENNADCSSFCNIMVDSFSDVKSFKNYVLPTVFNGSYYTQPLGGGIQLFPGDEIRSSQTIFIYNQDVNNSSCNAQSSFNVLIVKDCEAPQFFTPNNDGYNDTWFFTCSIKPVEKVIIFNRYGAVIIELSGLQIEWDGLKNGAVLPSNTYWYQVIYNDGDQTTGYFSLVRN